MALRRLGRSESIYLAAHRLLTSVVVVHRDVSMPAAATTFCFVVLLAFCFLASMALILGNYGSVDLVAGPGSSRLVQASSFLVQDITVRILGKEEEGRSEENGVVLYGLAGAPRLDVPAEWSEACRVVVPANSHRRWVYFLNRGSQIEMNYSVKTDTELICPLCVIIAQGKESFTRCTEKPSSAHSTPFSWHLVNGSGGTVKRTVDSSDEYYITVRNTNDHDTTVLLNFRIRAVLYDTMGADYACSPGNSVCTYRLPILGQNVAVLASGLKQRLNSDDEQYATVRLSYEPRWIVYIVGSAILAVSLLLLYEILSSLFGPCTEGSRSGGAVDQRASLLTTTSKEEEEDASLGSSYDSVSGDDDDDDGVEVEGRRLCVVCCDARRDCFFLPCGHSATCHACGTRSGRIELCRGALTYCIACFVGMWKEDTNVIGMVLLVSQDSGGRRW